MKLRNGFVSNSSSSSFIVRLKDWANPDVAEDLSMKDINKLKQYGFYFSYAAFPNQIESCKPHHVQGTGCSLCYDVGCNEDLTIDFLIKNEIPFMADLHYGHFSMSYDGDDTVYIFTNFGNYSQMGHTIKECKYLRPFVQVTKSEALAKTFSYQQVIYKKR